MTSPERSLHPASGNDRGAFLRALEFVACGRVQLAQIVGTVIGQRMPLEPRPQIFDRIEVWGVGWKKGDLDVPVQCVEVIAHKTAAMRVICRRNGATDDRHNGASLRREKRAQSGLRIG